MRELFLQTRWCVHSRSFRWEIRSLDVLLLKALGEDVFQNFLSDPGVASASGCSLQSLPLVTGYSLCLSVTFLPHVCGCRSLSPCGLVPIPHDLFVTLSAKTLFPNPITLWGWEFGPEPLLGSHNLAHSKGQVKPGVEEKGKTRVTRTSMHLAKGSMFSSAQQMWPWTMNKGQIVTGGWGMQCSGMNHSE